MRYYTVHERPTPVGAEPDFVLVKEGFNWPALFVPLLWLLVRRQWLGLAAYIGGAILLSVLSLAAGVGESGQAALALLYALLVAAEANNWRRWRLAPAGYRLAGVVLGPDLATAEARWLHGAAAAAGETGAVPAPSGAAASQQSAAPATSATATATPPRRSDPLTPFATPFDPV